MVEVNKTEINLDQALDRCDHELKLIANFYHQHGYLERAQDIYRTMFKIQAERHHSEHKDGDGGLLQT